MKRSVLWMFLCLIGFVWCGANCSSADGFAHVEVPFEAGVKSSNVEVQFEVPTPARHSFYLDLYYKDGDPRDPERAEDRRRVSNLAGDSIRDPKTNRQINRGLLIPVRLTVTRFDQIKNNTVIDAVYADHEREGFTQQYFSKLIVRHKLDVGRYKARIEALDNLPLLRNVPIKFNIHVAHDRS